MKYYPTNAVMNLTDKCNLGCKYCFVNFAAKTAELETAEQACEFLLNNKEISQAVGKPTFTFFGGEPLLAFNEIIKPLVDKYNDRITFSLTTNGTLLDEDKVDFLADHDIEVLLSIDGDRYSQNINRPTVDGKDSFDKVYKNIPYLLLRLPSTVFRSTLTKATIPYVYENYKFAEHMGFCEYVFIPNIDEEYDIEDCKILEEQLDKIAVEQIATCTNNQNVITKCKNFSKGLQLILTDECQYDCKRCGFGTTSIGIDTDGKLHPCQELNSTDKYIIGDVWNGIDIEAHQKFLSSYEEEYAKFLERYKNNCLFSKALIQSCCPKKLYDEHGFNITYGWKIYIKALYNVAVRLAALCYSSPNPYFIKAFELYPDEEDIICATE